MRTTSHRECNASYDPATDRYVGSFAPTEPGTVVRIHTPICVRAGRDIPAVIKVTSRSDEWLLNPASSVDILEIECPVCEGAGETSGHYHADDGMGQCDSCDGKGYVSADGVPLAGTWTLSMARPPTPEFDAASVPVGLRVTFEVET